MMNRKLDGIEVINCDSIQVYRLLDIGSAKPDARLLRELPHHLIDLLNPEEQFSAGYFVRCCDALIPQICARGRIPVISGGSLFYIKSFLHGIPDIPSSSGRYRAGLEQLDTSVLRERLRLLDEMSWQRIHPNDRQRLLRACEVCLETGRPFSAYQKPRCELRGCYQPLIITLELEREILYQRINQRVCDMFAQGLEGELLHLQQLGYGPDSPGLQGIGYREFWFEAVRTGASSLAALTGGSRQRLMQKIQQNSRNYAKRQLTFLRQLPEREVYHPSAIKRIAERILQFSGH